MLISQPLILAGGLGTRLRSVVKDRPKVMADINGRPFLELILDQLNEDNFKKVDLLIGYKGEIIRNHFGKTYKDLEISYKIERELLGTGGAIKNAAKNLYFEKLLVLNGDTYHGIFRRKLLENNEENLNFVVCQEINNPLRYGILKTDENNLVKTFDEKKNLFGKGLINAGTYIINKKDIESYPCKKFSLEKYFFPSIIRKNNLKALNLDGIFIDIGIPEDLEKARKFFK